MESPETHGDASAASLCNYKSVVDRYYTRKYKTDLVEKYNDHCVLIHSNRICVITIAPSHPILAEKKTVTDISFQVTDDTNHLQNSITGKSKKGATTVTASSPLCKVTCSDATQYTLCACLRGMLLEVNENLLQNPSLLTTKPSSDGYIGIVLCRLQDYNNEINKLHSQEKYEEKIKGRLTKENDA